MKVRRTDGSDGAEAGPEPFEVLVVSGPDVTGLRRCLGSVATQLPGTTVRAWVNRGADLDATRRLQAEWPDVDWTLAAADHGYASAVNALMARGHGDVLLLQSDVELTGPLTCTLARMRAEPATAVVSPTVAGTGRPWDVARRAPTLTRALLARAGAADRLRGSRWDERYRTAPDEVDGYLMAGCLLVSRAAWDDVGPFDEKRYYLFGEDRAWQARARDRGWHLRLVDEPHVRRSRPAPGTGTAVAGGQPAHRIRDLQLATSVLHLGMRGTTGRGTVLAAADLVMSRVQPSRRRIRRSERAGSGDRHAVVITTPQFGLGGAERQRALLANELAARGHRVTVVCLRDLGHLQRELDPAVRLVLRPWWQPFVDVGDDDAVLVSGTTNIEVGFATLWHGVTGVGTRRRWLVAAHNAPATEGTTYSAGLARAVSRSDGVIALSEGHWRDLTRDQHLHTRHWTVPNGVALQADRGYRPHRPLRIGFLGRLVEAKNPHLLAAALGRLPQPDWRLDVFGGGPDEQRLPAMVPDAVRDRVHWRGRTAGPAPALAEMDVLCLPSRHEAFPLVLLEAMACGIPVMASAVCAIPEMLDHGRAGVVVPESTTEAWTEAMRPVLADPSSLAGVARAGWERVRSHYTVPVMADGYQAVMSEALARR